jgi:acyl CoA:acetate/3-ketoacid CoA transferase beta subunit
MSDYEVTRIDQFVYSLTHFFLFSYFDRVSFEDVVKKTKWQKTLNDEIDVIKKNHT